MATFSVFTREQLQRVKLSEETINFYSSNPDALKELILERNYYKMLANERLKYINKFTKEFDEMMNSKIDSTGKTLRSFVYDKYYENLYSGNGWSSFAKF